MHPQALTLSAVTLPALGTPVQGAKYAGLSTGKDGTPYVLLLLDARTTPANHATQMAWAKSLGGDLPTRPEGALLFALLPEEFDKTWHWLSEISPWDARCACCQDFHYGDQFDSHLGAELPARAVRRLSLQSFGALQAAQQPAEAEATA